LIGNPVAAAIALSGRHLSGYFIVEAAAEITAALNAFEST